MNDSDRIAKLLVQSGAYTDLESPVILASGQLGIYYINTEKLLRDNGAWKEALKDPSSPFLSEKLIAHSIKQAKEVPEFNQVIDILAGRIEEIYPEYRTELSFISGGETRDWIFSGPVANMLGLPHFSIYKQKKGEPHEINIVTHDGIEVSGLNENLYGRGVHVVDLITEGSSIYDNKSGVETGWVPALRARGADIGDLLAVVSRAQGGEARLAQQRVHIDSFVTIDDAFLETHSTNPRRALAYQTNPQQWSEEYLKEHGALDFVDAFNPEGGNIDRANKFLHRFRKTLTLTGDIHLLEEQVKRKYGVSLD
ncbi:hypothetical protein GOV05_02980 [Candidatus Woesearchaeota archaeon]|nr:hypothetical protein [Candidatus Woesearchaeota archaeon]